MGLCLINKIDDVVLISELVVWLVEGGVRMKCEKIYNLLFDHLVNYPILRIAIVFFCAA